MMIQVMCNCLVLATSLLLGCAAIKPGNITDDAKDTSLTVETVATKSASTVPVDTIVAIDLVSVLMQLPDFTPFYTTVQFSSPRTLFGEAIVQAMTKSGFGIQMVSQDQGVNYVSYATRVVTAEEGETIEYSLEIGDLEIQRRYRINGNNIYPLSEVIVTGIEASKVIVNDEIYIDHALNSVFPSGVRFEDDEGRVMPEHTSVTEIDVSLARASGKRFKDKHYLVLARASIFTIDRLKDKSSSGYNKGDYLNQKQITVKFRPNSLSLGNANKRGISKMLYSFEPSQDIYIITGCSHGRSLMFDGTESMALSRSQRIMEELLSYGIKQDNLREEGCFQTEFGDTLPENGVIITHKRRLVSPT